MVHNLIEIPSNSKQKSQENTNSSAHEFKTPILIPNKKDYQTEIRVIIIEPINNIN